MSDKFPWFPLYAAAFSTDELVIPMTYEAEGIYNALLRHQWINGSVPAELRSALPKAVSSEALDQVRPCFPLSRSDPSVRFNPRLEEIRERVSSKREAAVSAGRKGGILSGLSRRRVASSDNEASLKRPSSIASSSSSSSKEASTPQGTEEQPRSGTRVVRLGKKDLKVREKTANRKTKEAALNLAAEVVFRYWRDRMGFDPDRTILNEKRRKRIVDRLRENGGDVSELLYCVDGALRDDWTMGRAPRSVKPFTGTQTIFRDREQVEALVGLVADRREVHPYIEAGDGQS